MQIISAVFDFSVFLFFTSFFFFFFFFFKHAKIVAFLYHSFPKLQGSFKLEIQNITFETHLTFWHTSQTEMLRLFCFLKLFKSCIPKVQEIGHTFSPR